MNKLPVAKKKMKLFLLWDDEDAVWSFVIEALQKLGYSVVLAGKWGRSR